ncbi:MAG TPA: 4'-phosphopantetheinyl transferase superfamily protein [Pirellulales bacterium]|nr:4'-phosphopantetheinyl transferase superfamily protein [Pirellulales bacterium]
MQSTEDELDVWRIATDRPWPLDTLWQTLSPDEQARADRFRFENDRRRAIVRRAALREILAAYVGVAARELSFQYGPQGKPALGATDDGAHGGLAWQFNLSFSGELALCAVAHAPLGIDLEAERTVENAHLVAKHFFTAGEIALQESADDPNQVFLRHWTRKEALIKATGSGLSVALNSFDVSWLPDGQSREVAVSDASGRPTNWWLLDVLPRPGWLSALATVRPIKRLSWHDWRE